MSIVDAWLDELTDEQLDRLAAKLAPRLIQQPEGKHPVDRWLRGAKAIAAYLGDDNPGRVYALSSANRIPLQHDGSILMAWTGDLDAWVQAGGAYRP